MESKINNVKPLLALFFAFYHNPFLLQIKSRTISNRLFMGIIELLDYYTTNNFSTLLEWKF